MEADSLLYDWNYGPPDANRQSVPFGRLAQAVVLDETLRDGIQSPSAIDPTLDQKIELLHLMDALGIVNTAGFTKVTLLAEGAKPQ